MSKESFIKRKLASGRPHDIADAEAVSEELMREREALRRPWGDEKPG